jgi:hypothetical protein
MTQSDERSTGFKQAKKTISLFFLLLSAGIAIPAFGAQTNLLQNPGFEDPSDANGNLAKWSLPVGITAKPQLTDQSPHDGKQALNLPARGSIEQKIESTKAGAYVARAWVKSQTEQTISLLVQDPNQGWLGFTLAEIKVPANQWTQIETFCSLQKDGSLTYTLGELSADFKNYHGVSAMTRNPIMVDDLELIRYEPQTPAPVTATDNKVQTERLVGVARADGSLEISAKQGDQLKPRCTIVPSIAMPSAKVVPVENQTRKGLKISSEKGDASYTAWFTPEGLVSVVADHIPQFQIKNCHLRYGLLPSFIGTDILYAPQKMKENTFNIPSTQWLVGLVDGNDSMLTAVWESDTQAASLGLTGEGDDRQIDSLTLRTEKAGFSLSLTENKNIWHKEALKEEWLGGYAPIAWTRPFQARWMCQFFVTPANKPTFRDANMEYSFPIASARTRLYGQCFEDFNRYPFYFEGSQLIFHFEKSFVPRGDALVYFLEPAFADLISPCEVVEQALGPVKAKALFDYEGNALRKLKYSTPDEFMYDRPVCATTTRLNNIKQAEKATIGVNLATHIYEFIREIRRRVDEYSSFYNQVQDYLGSEKKAHPEITEYLEELEAMVTDAQGRSKPIYAASLSALKAKTEGVKEQMLTGTGDGFKFGNLDCRDRAGEQDDLCRRNNRFVMRLAQVAAQKCGDDPQKAKDRQTTLG